MIKSEFETRILELEIWVLEPIYIPYPNYEVSAGHIL